MTERSALDIEEVIMSKKGLKFVSGTELGEEEVTHEFDSIAIFAEDGREMFRVRLGHDGHSLEISSACACKVAGVMYGNTLGITPRSSNSIFVEVSEWRK